MRTKPFQKVTGRGRELRTTCKLEVEGRRLGVEGLKVQFRSTPQGI